MQPSRWSPDLRWWWDGTNWIPAEQAPIPPPPQSPPGYAAQPPAYMFAPVQQGLQPSPGLRTFLIVVLAIDVAVTGFMSLFGVLGVAGGAEEPSGAILLSVFVVLLAIAVAGLVGVIVRAVWARWVA